VDSLDEEKYQGSTSTPDYKRWKFKLPVTIAGKREHRGRDERQDQAAQDHPLGLAKLRDPAGVEHDGSGNNTKRQTLKEKDQYTLTVERDSNLQFDTCNETRPSQVVLPIGRKGEVDLNPPEDWHEGDCE
jgi:hypothetical protein